MIFYLIILATIPPVFLAYYIYSKDLYEKEPRKIVLKSFLYGFFAFIPIFIIEIGFQAIFDHNQKMELFGSVFLFSFFVVASVEEGVKYTILKLYSFKQTDFNEPYDGIVYAVMISLGFAMIENILYVIQGGIDVAALRMFTAIPLHATCGVLMGYFVGKAKFKIKNRNLFLFFGILSATTLHAVYNYFLFINQFVIITIIALLIGIYFSKKAIKEHQNNSPFK